MDKLDALGNLLPFIGHYFLFIRVNTSDIHFMSLGKNDDRRYLTTIKFIAPIIIIIQIVYIKNCYSYLEISDQHH